MIEIPSDLLKRIVEDAEASYPDECCGLLIGAARRVTRVEPSTNVVEQRTRDRFEIDPQRRIDLERALRGTAECIMGVYHSHPDALPYPSSHDREMAWEPALIWLITSVIDGQAIHTTAHELTGPNNSFQETQIRITHSPASGAP
jgi:proteasome lid subunit RPN8/RPN11